MFTGVGCVGRANRFHCPAPRVMLMEAFLMSAGMVAVAEIGDKTQLLALMLAARYRAPLAIVSGIFIATVVNHLL